MTMDTQRGGIVTMDLLSGVVTYRPSQSSPEVVDLNLSSNTNLQLGLPAQPPTAVSRQLNYGSVCTLDKVRSALDRFERGCKKRKSTTADECSNTTTTSLSTISSSSVKKLSGSDEGADGESYESSSSVNDESSMALAGCPRCFMYVLISKGNPSCPRCGSHIPVWLLIESRKRTRMDLNP